VFEKDFQKEVESRPKQEVHWHAARTHNSRAVWNAYLVCILPDALFIAMAAKCLGCSISWLCYVRAGQLVFEMRDARRLLWECLAAGQQHQLASWHTTASTSSDCALLGARQDNAAVNVRVCMT
jgi:hypothetical protein